MSTTGTDSVSQGHHVVEDDLGGRERAHPHLRLTVQVGLQHLGPGNESLPVSVASTVPSTHEGPDPSPRNLQAESVLEGAVEAHAFVVDPHGA
jgi:hypothetical protein